MIEIAACRGATYSRTRSVTAGSGFITESNDSGGRLSFSDSSGLAGMISFAGAGSGAGSWLLGPNGMGCKSSDMSFLPAHLNAVPSIRQPPTVCLRSGVVREGGKDGLRKCGELVDQRVLDQLAPRTAVVL